VAVGRPHKLVRFLIKRGTFILITIRNFTLLREERVICKLRVSKSVRILVRKGDISILSVRKDETLLNEKWKAFTEVTKRRHFTEGKYGYVYTDGT